MNGASTAHPLPPAWPAGSQERPVSFESLEQTQLSPQRAAQFAATAIYKVTLAVGLTTIAVCFSRLSAAADFAERFGDMLATREADLVVYAVDRRGEAYFWRSTDRARRWCGPISNELLVFFADNVALHEHFATCGDIGIHAAVIARASHCVAIVGPSTAGKTTTALAAARDGFALYSDERCIVANRRVVPFLRAITVRAGARCALLADDAPDGPVDAMLHALPAHGESSVRPRLLVGESCGGPPRPLDALFVIEGRDATPSVEPCSVYAMLPALLRSMVSRESGVERAVRLLAELRAVALFRLRLGTPAATVREIERTLDETAAGPGR